MKLTTPADPRSVPVPGGASEARAAVTRWPGTPNNQAPFPAATGTTSTGPSPLGTGRTYGAPGGDDRYRHDGRLRVVEQVLNDGLGVAEGVLRFECAVGRGGRVVVGAAAVHPVGATADEGGADGGGPGAGSS